MGLCQKDVGWFVLFFVLTKALHLDSTFCIRPFQNAIQIPVNTEENAFDCGGVGSRRSVWIPMTDGPTTTRLGDYCFKKTDRQKHVSLCAQEAHTKTRVLFPEVTLHSFLSLCPFKCTSECSSKN